MSARIEFLRWGYDGRIGEDEVSRVLAATAGRPVFLTKVRHAYAIALSEKMLTEVEAQEAYEAVAYRSDW
jgi:hypothetical protein